MTIDQTVMTTQIQQGDKVVFIGDSITDCGRRDPVHGPLGQGYVKLFSDLLTVREPEKQVTIINTGIGGNTVEDLRNRWVDDALSFVPDWVSIKIGINDCHQWLVDGTEPQSPEHFAKIYDELLTVTRQALPKVKLLLIDPFYAGQDVEGHLPDSFRGKVADVLPRYLETVKRLSEKFNTLHVRTHSRFQEQFAKQDCRLYFPNEPVHPNSTGHLLIAEAVYETFSTDLS